MNPLNALVNALPSDVELLRRLVAIGSPTHDAAAVARVQMLLGNELQSLGLICDLIDEPGRGPHLLARTELAKRSAKSILLVAHADTVHEVNAARDRLDLDGDIPRSLPANKRLAPVVRAIGPGSLDLKGGVVCIVSALRWLSARNRLHTLPITVFVNSCEEEGTAQSADFVKGLAQSASEALVFEFGRDGDSIVTDRKGLRTYLITIDGRAGHAADTVQRMNAIETIIRLGHSLLERLQTVPNASINFGTILGGTRANVVAARAQLEIEIRAATDATLDAAQFLIGSDVQKVGGALAQLECIPPMVESAESAQLRQQYAQFGRTLGMVSERADCQGGVSDANVLAAAGVPTIDGLGPWGQFPHSTSECVDIASLPYKAAQLVMWLLSRETDDNRFG